jgi:hypothetical protein
MLDINWRISHANLFVNSSSEEDDSSDHSLENVEEKETLFEESDNDVSVEEPLPAGMLQVHPDESDDDSTSTWADSLSGSSADCAMSLTIVTRSAAADANVEFFI